MRCLAGLSCRRRHRSGDTCFGPEPAPSIDRCAVLRRWNDPRVNFGIMGSSTSKVCFNTKNSVGQDMSFYFNNDFQMVIDQNPCQ